MRNVSSGKRSLGIFVKFVKSWSFTDDESYLFVYIGNVWHFSNLIPKFLQYIFLVRDRRPCWLMKHYTIFFFRGIWMKKSLVLSGGKRYLFVSTYVAAVMSAEDLQWSCDHCSTNTRALLKPPPNGRIFVGQQHIVGCYILRPFAHPVTCFCMLLSKVWKWSNFRANNSQHFFCSVIAEACGATMLDPFALLFQHYGAYATTTTMATRTAKKQ